MSKPIGDHTAIKVFNRRRRSINGNCCSAQGGGGMPTSTRHVAEILVYFSTVHTGTWSYSIIYRLQFISPAYGGEGSAVKDLCVG